MNIRALAEKDLALTLENNGEGWEICFTDPEGESYKVRGRVGDIGFGYDTEGNSIAARVVQATWRLSSMMLEGKYLIPSRGWTCNWKDLSGKAWSAYVTRCEPDRTLGVGRVWLSFDLSEAEGDDGRD